MMLSYPSAAFGHYLRRYMGLTRSFQIASKKSCISLNVFKW